MKIIYRAENQIDANLVKDLLEQAGVKAFVGGEYLQGGVGDLPAGGLVTVSVADSDVEAARVVIDEFENQPARGKGDTRWDHLSDSLLSWKG